MIGSAIVNIVLDPLFIFGGFGISAMGIKGSAWAVFAGRFVIPLIAISVLIFGDWILDFILPDLTEMLDSWCEILRIGLPAALGNAVNPVSISGSCQSPWQDMALRLWPGGNALGHPMLGLDLYLIRTAPLYVLLTGLATLLFATTGVYAAIAATNVLAGVLVYFATFRWLDRMIEREQAKN